MDSRYLVLVIVLLTVLVRTQAQESHLFRDVDLKHVVLTSPQQELFERIQSRETSREVHLIEFLDEGTLPAMQAVTLPLPHSTSPIVFNRRYVQTSGDSVAVWSGTMQDQSGSALFTITGENVSAVIHVELSIYGIEPLGGGVHALVHVDPSRFAPDESFHGEMEEPTAHVAESGKAGKTAALRAEGQAATSVSQSNVIDILVAYTSAAASWSGGINNLIAACEARTNEICLNSGAAASVHIVHSVGVEYEESGSLADDLENLQGNGDGQMDEVHSLRQLYGADVVVLLVGWGDAYGRAFAIPALSPSAAFAVVQSPFDIAITNCTFAHEVGHLVGGRHQKVADGSNDPEQYCHGYKRGHLFKTVMAVNIDENTAPRIPFWSNPYGSYLGFPIGNSDTCDVSRLWSERVPIVAGFLTIPNPMYVPTHYPTISAALNVAQPGTRVIVEPGTHYVDQNLTVTSGVWLDIQSNATLIFNGYYKLRVEGRLTTGGPDIFTSSGSWYGLEFSNTWEDNSINGCTIQNAAYGIFVYNSDVPISGLISQDNSTGLYASCYWSSVSWSLFQDNYYGVYCDSYGDANLTSNNILRYNSWAVRGDATSQPYLGSYMGYNSLYWNDYYDIYSDYGGTIWARGNWWGGYPAYPVVSWNVDCAGELSVEPNNWAKVAVNWTGQTPRQKEVSGLPDTAGTADLDLAYQLIRERNIDQALFRLDALMSRLPDSFAGMKALALATRIREERGQTTAEGLYATISQYAGTRLELQARHLMVGLRLKSGATDEALRLAEALTAVSDSLILKLALYDAGNILWYRKGAFSRAEGYFHRLSSLWPKDPLTVSVRATMGESSEVPLRQPVGKPLDRTEGLLKDVTCTGMEGVYPNPFNSQATIRYQVAAAGPVRLTIYDVLGREVVTLVTAVQQPGDYAVQWNADGVVSGVYLARLTVADEAGRESFRRTQKLILTK
jgi:hypothetical protein